MISFYWNRYSLAGLCIGILLSVQGWSQFAGWEGRYFGAGETLISGDFTCITQDSSGVLWFGTERSGLVQYDGFTWNYTQHVPGDTTGIFSNNINQVFSDLQLNRVFVGTSNGVNVFKNGAWEFNLLGGNNILSIASESQESYWIGTGNGLVNCDIVTGDTAWYFCPPSDFVPPTRNENAFVSLLFDPGNRDVLWVGSQNGLKSFNLRSKTFTHHYNPPKWHDRLPEYQQYYIKDMVFHKGVLHLGAAGSGGVLTHSNHSWSQYLYEGGNKSAPYIGNYVNTLQSVEGETLLVGTTKLLGYVDYEIGHIVQVNSIVYPGHTGPVRDLFQTSNRQVWLAADNGLIRLTPEISNGVEPLFPSRLTRLFLEGQSMDLPEDMHFTFPYDRINARFEFSSPNPLDPHAVHYRWRLDGYDSDWREVIYQGVAIYEDLKGGEYTFQFQSRVEAGEWRQGRPVHLVIRTPWYRNYILLLILSFLLISIALLIIRTLNSLSRARVMRRMTMEKRAIAAELAAFRSQMNPQFIFNSLHSVYNFILNDHTERAADYLSKFATLMRSVLIHSQSRSISLTSELETLELFLELEQIRVDKAMDYTIVMASQEKPGTVFIPPLLLQPYVERAIWQVVPHVDAETFLSISLRFPMQDRLEVTIEMKVAGPQGTDGPLRIAETREGEDLLAKRLKSLSVLHNAPFEVRKEEMLNADGKPSGIRYILDIQILDEHVTDTPSGDS